MSFGLAITAFFFGIVERFSRFRFRKSNFFRVHFASDAIYLITGSIVGSLTAAHYLKAVSQWLETFTGLPKISSDHIYSWVLILPSLLILDFGNYLCHYFLHRFDFLWEFHKIHHSSPTLDWLATFRSHVLEQLLRRFLSPVLLILFGFPVNSVLTAWTILLGWAIFNHSNLHLDLQFMEWIFITPRLHRVHHLPDQSERNLGTVFTFWDQIRGTLAKIPTNDQSRFGNGDSNYPQSWGPQFIEPLKDLSFTKSVLKLYDQIV